MQSDADLVRDVLAGRREAYAELVHRHERAMLAEACAVLGNLAAAEDAAQDAFFTAFRRLNTLRDQGAFGAWAVRITRRAALRMARGARRTESLAASADPAAPSRDGELDEVTQHVMKVLDRLPEKQRQAVRLKYFAGHNAEEIARMTGQALGTVHSQLSRAAARLREWLRETQQWHLKSRSKDN